MIFSANNKKQLYIPEGFSHAYQVLADSVVNFKVTTHWIPGDEIGFAWNSKELGIDWPIYNLVHDDSDRTSPDFSELIF